MWPSSTISKQLFVHFRGVLAIHSLHTLHDWFGIHVGLISYLVEPIPKVVELT